MYQNVKRTCRAIVLLIKPAIVLQRCPLPLPLSLFKLPNMKKRTIREDVPKEVGISWKDRSREGEGKT